MATKAAASSTSAAAAVRKVYRELLHIAKQQSPPEAHLQELRTEFRRPLDTSNKDNNDDEARRLKQAHDKLGFLKIACSGITFRKDASKDGSRRFVYKDGERLEAANGTLRTATGRVVSSYDGKNLDPEAVTKHRKNLKRAGFLNNSHAKGIF